MKAVEIYARVRHAVLIEGISERAAADRFGINARTVSKMLKFSVPPGYVRTKPPARFSDLGQFPSHFIGIRRNQSPKCESRSNNPSLKRPICLAAPEQNCGS